MNANDVVKFAFALYDADEFDTAEDVMEYLKKPSLWTGEFESWRELGGPRPGDSRWEDFIDVMESRDDD